MFFIKTMVSKEGLEHPNILNELTYVPILVGMLLLYNRYLFRRQQGHRIFDCSTPDHQFCWWFFLLHFLAEKGKNRMNKKVCISFIAVLFGSKFAVAGPFTDPNKLGDLLMTMGAGYALGMTVQAKDFIGTVQFAESVVLSQGVTEILKRTIREERPNGSDNLSFPSGHSAGAFSSAMFVHKRYGWRSAVVPYAMAVLTGWTRVHVRAHYWHDVLAGAAVSAIVTWGVVDSYDTKVNLSADTNGFRLSFRTLF